MSIGQTNWKGIAETLLAAAAGGALYSFLHIPLAWMLGPMTAVLLLYAVGKRPLAWPAGLRNAGLVALGYMMGQPFTRETAALIGRQLPLMALSTLLTIGFSLLLGYTLARRAGLNEPTSLIGNIPGGLTQMVTLSEEVPAADVTAVTFLQTMRLLTVVFAVPFVAVHGIGSGAAPSVGGGAAAAAGSSACAGVVLASALAALAGAWAAARLRLPTPWLLGPMVAIGLLAAAGLPVPRLPAPLLMCAQLFVGAHLGLSAKPDSLQGWRRLLPYSLLASIGLVAFSLALGALLTTLVPVRLATGFLGTSPGGMAEMGATAFAVHADLSVVAAYQTFRLFAIMFAIPPLLRWWLRRSSRKQAAPRQSLQRSRHD